MHDILDRLEDFQALYTQIPAWYSSRATVSFVPFRYDIYLLSYLRITELRVTGNILQLFDIDGWDYHRHVLDCCEFCVIFSFGDFWYTGLRRASIEDHWRVWGEAWSSGFEARYSREQERLLFTFDPKALHHILVKDQHMYELGGFTSYVFTSGRWLGNLLIHLSRNQAYFGEGLLATLGTLLY